MKLQLSWLLSVKCWVECLMNILVRSDWNWSHGSGHSLPESAYNVTMWLFLPFLGPILLIVECFCWLSKVVDKFAFDVLDEIYKPDRSVYHPLYLRCWSRLGHWRWGDDVERLNIDVSWWIVIIFFLLLEQRSGDQIFGVNERPGRLNVCKDPILRQ